MNNTLSPTYPYEKIQQFVSLRGADELPRQVIHYLMDLPLPGYTPPDDNQYPRARLMKYLFYDDTTPLSNPVPTTQQKMDILFDPLHPTTPPNTEKGYRIFPQPYIAQSQVIGASTMYVYMGQSVAKHAMRTELSVVIRLMTNVVYETNSESALSRTFAMECAVLEALNGVNLNGIGTFYFDRTQHPSCGSWDISDRGTNVGRQIVLGLTWCPERTEQN